ncbi:EAL domain-containing response regulator [Achromobacter aegrifaciens]|uniref:EAL domain-containing response regulator n=1 Tax=Achromobacter aegrifaciens TaxID=1287736 RepID=UPI0027B8BF68|nr:EAL domain-containing response regulator [Achromobacter aegrifaciens]WLW63584.1 EAL domain-containing response regulator [Achromobacter aegrifaciens]
MLSKYKVLVLDDHEFSCARVRAILGDAGFTHIETAQTVEQALKLMHANRYEIVLMDIKMHDLDGVQFISRLAKENLSPMLAICSSCSRRIITSVSLMAKEVGLVVLDAFSKPFDPSNAQTLISKLRHRAAEEPHFNDPCFNQSLMFDKPTIETALNTRKIQAWFQPKKALRNGEIVGAEALARWAHPEHGFMLPSSFLAAIRYHQLDHRLLQCMLEDAIAAHRSWRDIGYTIPISVNLPVPLLENPDLPDELDRTARLWDVPPGNITFELLEDETTSTPAQYYMGASRLRLKGFGLAQDDFGKGYSSMYNLISMPFTELKIDRALVACAADDADRSAALTSAVQLGKQLGLSVTAEGVETIRDLEFLRYIGCDCVQGFLISSALKPCDFASLLNSEQRRQLLPPEAA